VGSEEVTFGRETQVVLIPDGVAQLLPEGTRGWVTQVLGGNYTIQLETGRLVRLGADDVDAIGKQKVDNGVADGGPVTPDRVWEVLRTCYDPEIPLDIVQLGLIYELLLREHEGGDGVDVEIIMTLTAPGCGMGQVLADDVQSKVSALPGVKATKVELTFDPPWSPDRMSEEAKLELGMFY
jgi:probable FeS assembly SUF system protein SufT